MMKEHLDEKAMKQYAEMFVEQLSQMEESNWQKPWISQSSFVMPQNINGRHYTLSNVLMLLFDQQQRHFELPVYMTFRQATEMGLTINKGSKSFPVSFWNWLYKDENGHRITEQQYRDKSYDEQQNCKVFAYQKFYNVFNLDQTDIKTSHPERWRALVDRLCPPSVERDDSQMIRCDSLDSMLENQSWLCPIHLQEGDRAFYSMGSDSITVPLKRQFIDGESFYGTLLHEMAHSTGTAPRLNRLKPAAFGSDSYGREELVAELSSALAAIQFGINKTIKDESLQYIKSWLESMKQDPKFLMSVLSDTAKAVNLISEQILEVERELDEPESFEKEPMVVQETVEEIGTSEQPVQQEPTEVWSEEDGQLEQWHLKQLYDGLSTFSDAALALFRSGRFSEEPTIRKTIEYLESYVDEQARKGAPWSAPYVVDISLLHQVKQANLDVSYRDLAQELPKTDRRVAIEWAKLSLSSSNLYDIRMGLFERGDQGRFVDAAFLWNQKMNLANGQQNENEMVQHILDYLVESRLTSRGLDQETLQLDGMVYQLRVEQIGDQVRYVVADKKDDDKMEELISIDSEVILQGKEAIPMVEAKQRIGGCIRAFQGYHPLIPMVSLPEGVHLSEETEQRLSDAEYLRSSLVPALCQLIQQQKINFTQAAVVLRDQHRFDHLPSFQELAELLNPYFPEEWKINLHPLVSPEQEPELEGSSEVSWMASFDELKRAHPDSVLLFRTGGDYEAYHEDAQRISEVLGVPLDKLTFTKAEGLTDSCHKVSFPYSRLDDYLSKLVRSGVRIAIYDSLEELSVQSQAMREVDSLDGWKEERMAMEAQLSEEGRSFQVYCRSPHEKRYHAMDMTCFRKADSKRSPSILTKLEVIERLPFLQGLTVEGTAIQVRTLSGKVSYQTEALLGNQPLELGEDRPLIMAHDPSLYQGIYLAELGDRQWSGLIDLHRNVQVLGDKVFSEANRQRIQEVANQGNLVFSYVNQPGESEYVALLPIGEPTRMTVDPETAKVTTYHLITLDGERYAVNGMRVCARGDEVDRLVEITPERMEAAIEAQEERIRQAKDELREVVRKGGNLELRYYENDLIRALQVRYMPNFDRELADRLIQQIYEEGRSLSQSDTVPQVAYHPDEQGIRVVDKRTDVTLGRITPDRQVFYECTCQPEVQAAIEEFAREGNLFYEQPVGAGQTQTTAFLALNPLHEPSKIYEPRFSTQRQFLSVETVEDTVCAVQGRRVVLYEADFGLLMDKTPAQLAAIEARADFFLKQAEDQVRTALQDNDPVSMLQATAELEVALQYKYQQQHTPESTQRRIEEIKHSIYSKKMQEMEANNNEKKELKDGISVFKMQNGLYGINEVKDGVRSATRRLSEEDVQMYFEGLKGQPKEEVDRRRAILADKYLHQPEVKESVESIPVKSLDPVSDEVKSRLSHASVFKMQDGVSYGVRTQIDGEQYSAKRVKREDIAAFFDGYKGLPKEQQEERKSQLAAMYFKEELHAPVQDVSQGLHR